MENNKVNNEQVLEEQQEVENETTVEEKQEVELVNEETIITPDNDVKKVTPLSIIRKVLAIIGSVIVAVLVLLVALFGYDKFINKNEVPTAFGYGVVAIKVEAQSMSGTIEGGDMVVIQKCDEYKIGDIITYLEDQGNGATMIVTHRIVGIEIDLNGNINYITLGDANHGAKDTMPKLKVFGKVVDIIPQGGIFITWIKEENGWVYALAFIGVIGVGSYLLTRKED